ETRTSETRCPLVRATHAVRKYGQDSVAAGSGAGGALGADVPDTTVVDIGGDCADSVVPVGEQPPSATAVAAVNTPLIDRELRITPTVNQNDPTGCEHPGKQAGRSPPGHRT